LNIIRFSSRSPRSPSFFCGPLFTGWVKMVKCWFQAALLRAVPALLGYQEAPVQGRDAAEKRVLDIPVHPLSGLRCFGHGGASSPSFPGPALSATADVIALVALFAIARFFTALAGMDIGTAFGGMGSSREMTIASLAEPAMLMAVFAVSLVGKSTSLSQMSSVIAQGHSLLRPSLVFALLAFILIALAETGRVPVDNPATHWKLTMIHEAMILEYSGRHLALIEWAGMMKLFLFVVLGSRRSFPGGPHRTVTWPPLSSPCCPAAEAGMVGIGLVLIETGLAKMRIFRITEFLGSAFLFATIGMMSYFMLE